MKVNSITERICKSKLLKDGLAYAGKNSSIFIAGTQLALSTVARPLSIMATPKTDRENKKLACAKSISSSLVYYGLTLGLTTPIIKGVEEINKTPNKYLKPETITTLKNGSKTLGGSKTFQFATQLFKLGSGALMAIPKAILTCALIPPIISLMKSSKSNKNTPMHNQSEQIQAVNTGGTSPSFKGLQNTIPKTMGKVLDNKGYQKFSEKLKDTNFCMHTMALTDTLTTTAFIYNNSKSKKIDESRKRTLNYNAGISTSLSILSGYALDKALNKPTEKFIKKFSQINKGDENLPKYLEGIKIAKPAIILGSIYYIAIPFISTFLADRTTPKK
jgi:hypothetical protein